MKIVFKSFCVFFLLLTSCKSNLVTFKSYDSTPKQDSLASVLCQIYGSDQGIRDSNLKHKDFKMIQEIDTLNFKRVIDFVKVNGYPTKQLLGEKNMNLECVNAAFTCVLLHNPHRLINEEEYFQFFLNEVKNKNMQPDFLASILDKYYWTKSKNKVNRRVFYGSQFGKPCIQTKEATNKARMEINLHPLKDNEFIDCAGEQLDMPKIRN
jgi:hypothetical protein